MIEQFFKVVPLLSDFIAWLKKIRHEREVNEAYVKAESWVRQCTDRAIMEPVTSFDVFAEDLHNIPRPICRAVWDRLLRENTIHWDERTEVYRVRIDMVKRMRDAARRRE